LRSKIVYCNCDIPESNFVKFLNDVKDEWGIKDIWHTSLDEGVGFDDNYAKELLTKCDIVITNPPFSIFHRFISTLMQFNKLFLVIGNKNSINNNGIFHYIKSNKMWLGYTKPSKFNTPHGETNKLQGMCRWFTNLEVEKGCNSIYLSKKYTPDKYPTYENYNAINVDRILDIPYDYNGVMGVPITFLDKYNPNQFEILGRSGDTFWAINECSFFTPPTTDKQRQYKAYNRNWRIQNSYLIGEDGLPKCIYYRMFIRKKCGEILTTNYKEDENDDVAP
jgi:hypothetical protein